MKMSKIRLIAAAVAALSLTATGVAVPNGVAFAQQYGQKTSPKAAPNDSRDAYVRQNEGTFEEWGKKVDAFNAKAAQRGTESKDAAKRELDNAWAETKAGWEKLKNASKDTWEGAKASFEASRQKLERAWNNVQS
jgi:hypothetical protein